MGVLGEKIGLRGRASLFLEKLYVGNNPKPDPEKPRCGFSAPTKISTPSHASIPSQSTPP